MYDTSHRRIEAFLIAPASVQVRSIVWDGRAWLAAYATETSVCTVRFTSEIDLTSECEAQTTPRTPSIAAGSRRTFKAWGRALEQILTDDGIASLVPASQIYPTATVDAQGLHVAWIEDGRIRSSRGARIDDGSKAVAFVRLSGDLAMWVADGAVWSKRIGAFGAAVHLGAGSAPVSVAANDRGWVVAWVQAKQLVSTFVTANGDPTGLEQFGSPAVEHTSPRVAATPAGFIVAWNEMEGRKARVIAEPLDANGRRVSGGIHLTGDESPGAIGSRVSLGCNMQRCLVVWRGVYAMVIGHDAKPISEPRFNSGADAYESVVVPRRDGTFDIYSGPFVTSVDGDGKQIAFRRWAPDMLSLGAIVPHGDSLFAVYARSVNAWPRVFVRDLASRSRAARH